jgi:hypothetical protein
VRPFPGHDELHSAFFPATSRRYPLQGNEFVVGAVRVVVEHHELPDFCLGGGV